MAQYSFRIPNADYLGFPATPQAIVDTAWKAEELGFDALFVNDHVIVDDSPRSALWRNVYDPLMVLSYVAARTSAVKLGTSVLIMPYRNPVVTAKMVATLDQMSGGRAIAGVGSGWNEAEYAALGVSHGERGARTNEYLRLWKACWEPGATSFHGRFFWFDNMHVYPKPLQQPHPPIWIGGSSQASLRRAARFAEVWQPTPTPLADLKSNMAYLRDVCAEVERKDVPRTRMSFRVNFSHITGSSSSAGDRPTGQGIPEQVASDMKRYRQEAGLEEFQINFNGCGSLQQLLDSMDVLVEEVIPRVDD
jgi:probable F420-dependent oxidoreductase